MYRLVSDIDGSRWSYLNGYMLFGNVVILCSKDEASKYVLIDENGKKIEVNPSKYLMEY